VVILDELGRADDASKLALSGMLYGKEMVSERVGQRLDQNHSGVLYDHQASGWSAKQGDIAEEVGGRGAVDNLGGSTSKLNPKPTFRAILP
jgi:hypothetical protein